MGSSAAFADAAWRRGLAPEPQLRVSSWADRHRMLPSTSSEPGRWRTDRTPYLREIMDALSTGSPYERVVFMKGAQIGGTEAGLNWLAYIVANAPGLALLVMPSLDMVRRNTRTRIDPLIESTPALRERIAPARSRDSQNTAWAKAFPGGQIVMTGANSASGLRSTPARYLFLDEVDGFPSDADGEGDPVDLAVKRTATFRGKRKMLLVSTPTIKDASRIEAAYLESDQRQFVIPCPGCGVAEPLRWRNVIWPEGDRRAAYMVCEHCGHVIEERDKPALLASGFWRAEAEGDGRTAGFHLNSLYSPFEPWGEIAVEHGRVKNDPARLQVWVNTALGETWEDRGGETVEPEGLVARRQPFGDRLPEEVLLLTCGVDVQKDRLEATLVGWGEGEASWIIEHRVIWGDPSGPAAWQDLDAYLLNRWTTHDGLSMGLKAACVDSGGLYTGASYEFCRTRMARRIWAIKGRGGPGVKPWPRRASSGKGGAPLFIVGVDAIKDTIAARLSIETPGPGHIAFSAELEPTWFDQLTAERVLTRYKNGRPERVWEPRRPGIRNEALDCFVYASAALHGLYAAGLRLQAAAPPVIAPNAPREAPQVVRSNWMSRR